MDNEPVEVEVLGKAEPVEELAKPKRNRMRDMPIKSEMRYSDEQLVNIAKNTSLEVTKLIFEHFDPSSPTSATAMVAAVGQLAKIAQDDIKLKQDQEAHGQIAGAANAVAQIFTKVISNASEKRPLEQDPIEGASGKVLEDNTTIELAPNETFIGVEHIEEKDIMNTGSDNEYEVAKETDQLFK